MCQNILDLIDDIDHDILKEMMKPVLNACKNFRNRLDGKKMKPMNDFLFSIFDEKNSGLLFNEYRDQLLKTIDFIIQMGPEIEYLKLIREIDVSQNCILLSQKEARSLIRDSRFSNQKPENFLNAWLEKKT